jgi:hypothetical protein
MVGVCMTTSQWILLGFGVLSLSIGIVVTLSRAFSSLGSVFQGLGNVVSNIGSSMGYALLCGLLVAVLYWLLTSTLQEGTWPW